MKVRTKKKMFRAANLNSWIHISLNVATYSINRVPVQCTYAVYILYTSIQSLLFIFRANLYSSQSIFWCMCQYRFEHTSVNINLLMEINKRWNAYMCKYGLDRQIVEFFGPSSNWIFSQHHRGPAQSAPRFNVPFDTLHIFLAATQWQQ